MPPKYDIDYLLVREAEERLAARYAACAPSRQAHAKLADLYADQTWAIRDARFEEN
jgi:hypothetical protein